MQEEKKIVYREGLSSTIEHNKAIYLVDDLLRLTQHKAIQWLPIDKLDWILTGGPKLDIDRVTRSETVYPVIVVNTKRYGYVVLDGVHRLQKAIRINRTQIMARVISEKELSTLNKFTRI